MRRNSTLLLATLLLGPTCAPIDPDIALEPFSDCAQMRDTMARMARKEALYNYRFRGVFNTFLMGCSDFALVGGDKNGSGDTGGASSYSTTNVQEAGVDESDLVKTDGTWLYSLSGRHLSSAAPGRCKICPWPPPCPWMACPWASTCTGTSWSP